MRTRDIEPALVGVNPIDPGALPEIGEADAELLATIFAAQGVAGTAAAPPRRAHGKMFVALALVAALLLGGLAVALGDPGGKPVATPEHPYDPELVRFANASPLVLLDRPGWRVEDATESSASEGEISFIERGRPISKSEWVNEKLGPGVVSYGPPLRLRQLAATLFWRPGPLHTWVADRAADLKPRGRAGVLGSGARVFEYGSPGPGTREFTALWQQHGRVLEFRSTVPDLTVFRERLAGLRGVSANAWLAALPPKVVKSADRNSVVHQMLAGIPLPPGFRESAVPNPGLTTDRYQLGTQVAGTISCLWFRRWALARQRGDRGIVDESTRAMATARRWPLLKELSKEGAYPQILEEFASHMPSGLWHHRPLVHDVNSGLGCQRLGVGLPKS